MTTHLPRGPQTTQAELRWNMKERHGTTWNTTERRGKGEKTTQDLRQRTCPARSHYIKTVHHPHAEQPHPPNDSQNLSLLTRSHPDPPMTTRSAEEAGLPEEHEGRRNVRLRLEDPPNADIAEPVQEDLDALSYVAIPAPEDLDIHGWNQHTIFKNLDLTQRALWTAERDTKLLVYRAYGGRIEDREVVTKLHDEIKGFANLSTNPVVAILVPQTKGRKDSPPFCALITGITAKTAEELINKVRTPPHLIPPSTHAPTEIHVHPGPHSPLHPLRPQTNHLCHDPQRIYIP